MDRQQVIGILSRLLDGVDPSSSAVVEVGEEEVVALQAAISLLTADGERRGKFAAAGTPWTDEEDERLAKAFDGGSTVAQIALQHGRTSSAITLRLVKLSRIDPATVKRRERAVRVA